MQTAKEKISNMGTTVKEGMDKSKASTQEKIDKVTAHDPAEKEIAREKKDARKSEAEVKANNTKAEHRAENEGVKQTGHTRTGYNSAGNIGGDTNFTGAGTPGTYDPSLTGRHS